MRSLSRPQQKTRRQTTANVARTCPDLPVHPVVAVKIEDLQVRALIDTGSMKSFISSHVHAILDFDSCRLQSNSINCISITGNALNILGSFNTAVQFNSRTCFAANF